VVKRKPERSKFRRADVAGVRRAAPLNFISRLFGGALWVESLSVAAGTAHEGSAISKQKQTEKHGM
jgi:hypothetical protein